MGVHSQQELVRGAIQLVYLQIDSSSELLAGVHSLVSQLLLDSQDLFS
jgi:hypothetical protein